MATTTAKTSQPRLTLEQQRAKHAWECVSEAKQKLGHDYDKYANLAKSIPALIMNSGLMQVMAFLHEKGLDKKTRKPDPSKPHTIIGDHLRSALTERFPEIPKGFEGAMAKLMEADPRKFQAITAEAFAWLKWLRQMAAAQQG